MLDSFLFYLKCYQTFIVGFLGFSGVIITIYMNSKVSRDQHNRLIKHERNSVRTALYSELEVIRKTFEDRCKMDEETGGLGAAFFPEEISNLVYVNFINKIGLLSTSEIEEVIVAYSLISDLPIRLKLLSVGHDSSFDRPGHIFISAEHANTAIGIHKSFLPKIESALSMLRSNMDAKNIP